ncbi:MAG: sensor histidine kinase [Planctomycetota bacterium]|jgi:two-component system sensor histidine kinase QseC
MYSIRRRLTLVLAVGFAVLIVGGGVVVGQEFRDSAVAEFDAALTAKANALVSLTEQEGGHIEFDYDAAYMQEYERSECPDYFQFRLDDGTVLLRSARMPEDFDFRHLPWAADGPAIRDATLPDGRAGRLVQVAYVPKGSGEQDDTPPGESEEEAMGPASETRGLILVVARGRDRLDRLLTRMWMVILGAGLGAVLLAAVLVWRVLRRGFRPLDAIAAQVGALDSDQLDARVCLRRTPRELAPIVDQLNALLRRLDASFERERRFTGNVAHELRTPIAELRSLATVGAKWPEDEASVAAFFDDVGDIAGRMEGVIADLLLLARCQAGVEGVVDAPTSIRELITSTCAKLRERAAERGLRFRVDLPDDMVVRSDAGKLQIVIANLLGNAVSYARPKTEIRCRGARSAGRFGIEITNQADPLSPADLEHLAEPFWRKDAARSSAEHAGLGLSLVAALASLLRMEVRFEQDADGTFRARLAGRGLESTRTLDRTAAPT